MRRRKWQIWLSAVVGVLAILRAAVYFTQSDEHAPVSAPVTFDPTGGPPVPSDLPSGLPTGVPSISPTDIPSVIPSDAPTVTPLGPVRYQVTGNGARASVVEYTTASLTPVDVEHPRLPYAKTIAGGIGDYFTVYAEAAGGTTVTCKILAHRGTVEVTQTAHGAHAHVSCRWQVPY